jgi:hypothetical protein
MKTKWKLLELNLKRMIDITTIQTFDIAPSIQKLMETNEEVNIMNTNLKTGIIVLVIVSGITLLYLMKINKDLKQNFNKQIKL